MRIEPIVPDVAAAGGAGPSPAAGAFGTLLDAASAQLERAQGAEAAFAAGRGGLQEMVLERARADIALQVAAAAATHAAQALNTLLGMPV